MSKLFVRQKLNQIELRNKTRFKVNQKLETAELSMLADIWLRHVYERDFLKIEPTDVVLDIGANKGYFTIYAARQAQHVYSIEPVPRLVEFIKYNTSLNNLLNVSVFEQALWDRTGRENFYISSNSGGHGMRPKPSTIGEITVETTTLEQFCRDNKIERIDFLKLDCEGSEYNIILTLSEAMLGRIGKIAMECHDFLSFHHSQIRDFLQAKGFEVLAKKGYLYAYRKDLQSLQ